MVTILGGLICIAVSVYIFMFLSKIPVVQQDGEF